ncbi:spore coat protein GerQ [Pueribacillus theae]|nr:spore coat protein GerQ [Pueribacillus theae]
MQGNWNQMYGQYPYYGQQYQGYTPYPQQPAGGQITTPPDAETPAGMPAQLPVQQSYIENILRLNRGKVATVYCTFENNEKWNARVFKGIVLAAGRDHVILKDPQSPRRYIILMIYVDFITFDEEIEYSYPYGLDTQTPR